MLLARGADHASRTAPCTCPAARTSTTADILDSCEQARRAVFARLSICLPAHACLQPVHAVNLLPAHVLISSPAGIHHRMASTSDGLLVTVSHGLVVHNVFNGPTQAGTLSGHAARTPSASVVSLPAFEMRRT